MAVSASNALTEGAAIRTFRIELPQEEIDGLRQRGALAGEGDRRRSVPGRPARGDSGTRALLGHRLRLPESRGKAERPPAVHYRNRRSRHPLHLRHVVS